MSKTANSRSSSWRRLLRDRAGNVTTEFALILPATVLLVGGLIEFGLAVNAGTSLENGARAGAQYAIAKGLDVPGIAATVAAATNLPVKTSQVTAVLFYECSGSWGTQVPAGTNCGTGVPLARFVQVTVTQPYTPYLPLLNLVTPSQLHGSATVRTS